jgi:hypothetical protein
MTKDQVRAVVQRVPTWPQDRQQKLAELALEIEGELAGGSYEATHRLLRGDTPNELTAIDEGLAGEAASEGEIKAAFACYQGPYAAENRSSSSKIPRNDSSICPRWSCSTIIASVSEIRSVL